MTTLETDYLVVGAGAAGMAFVDEMLTHSDADVVLVDRRHQPGGHWNDAYPFVTLHLPSAYYGVNSRPLGDDRIDEHGTNAGLYERASGVEVRDYYLALLRDRFLPSGRVRFLGMHEFEAGPAAGARVRSLLTGAAHDIAVRRKTVDATYLETSVPATNVRSFAVEPGARVIPVGELVNLREPASTFVLIGAGKTSLDACVWLLEHDVEPERITWIRPRDAWFLDRAGWQPLELLPALMDGLSLELEALARAETSDDLLARLEDCGRLVRIDRDVQPTMYHCATVNSYELELLRTVGNVVRLGHVRRVAADEVALEHGTIPVEPGTLFVDCSAYGLRRPPRRPVFEGDRITIQQVRACAPTFNAALIGYVEATRTGVEEQNRLCPSSVYPDQPNDWLRVLQTTFRALGAWRKEPDVQAWVERSRLNMFRGVGAHAADPQMQRAGLRYAENVRPAMAKLAALVDALDAAQEGHHIAAQRTGTRTARPHGGLASPT
jgi:hypothetical protein